MRISTLSHPVRRMSTGAFRVCADTTRNDTTRRGPVRRRSRERFAHKTKGKTMVWITGALSIALFIYLFHALIKPERY